MKGVKLLRDIIYGWPLALWSTLTGAVTIQGRRQMLSLFLSVKRNELTVIGHHIHDLPPLRCLLAFTASDYKSQQIKILSVTTKGSKGIQMLRLQRVDIIHHKRRQNDTKGNLYSYYTGIGLQFVKTGPQTDTN